MKYKEYLEGTRRTWADLPEQEDNTTHALLGIIDECGEIASQYKGHLAYNKELLVHTGKGSIKEEVGDLMYFLTRFIDELKFKDIDKLIESIDNILNQDFEVPKGASGNVITLNMAAKASSIFLHVSSRDGEKIVDNTLGTIQLLMILCKHEGLDMLEVLDSNQSKLKARFPNKFTEDDANNRDFKSEEKALDGNE